MPVKDLDIIKKIENIAGSLATVTDMKSLAIAIEEIISGIVTVEYLCLYIQDRKAEHLNIIYCTGLDESYRSIMERTAINRHPGRVWKNKKVLYIPDEDDESKELYDYSSNLLKVKSRLFIPVIRNEVCIGTLSLGSINKNHFDEDKIALLSFITNLAGVIYKNLLDNKQLERISERIKIVNRNSLSQKLESIGQLASGIAHELNTPLQYIGDNINFLNGAFEMIISYVESLKELGENINEFSKEQILTGFRKLSVETDIHYFLSEIPAALHQSVEGLVRVSDIVKALKDFAGPVTKEKSLKNINKSLQDTVLITRNEWKSYAEIEFDLDPDLPLLYCLSDEINQVFLNMIFNSVQAICSKIKNIASYNMGKMIIRTNQENNYIVIKIIDDGIGIVKEITDKIFDPFFTTKEAGQGTGQGLAIAHDVIVNKHGGEIKVESIEGETTCFTILLPNR